MEEHCCCTAKNYSMALNKLSNLDKHLQRSSEIAMEYQTTIKLDI